MIISELRVAERGEWDAYVRVAPGGLPHHLSGWRDVLTRTYGTETRYLLARVDGRIVGVLPLFFVRSRLLGNRATTMPGGLCADSDTVARALVERGQALAREAGMRRLRLQDSRQPWPGPFHTRSDHVHWLLELGTDEAALWSRLGNGIRRQVRIARKHGLTAVSDTTGAQLDAFYNVFSRFAHRVGTPVFGRSFLQNVIDTFPGGFNIVVVYQEKRPLAAYFQLQMGDTVYGMWGAALPEYLSLRPVYLAYWHILQEGICQGVYCLDMGRSPAGSNASSYKKQWGGVSRPIYQQVMATDGTQTNVAPTAVAQPNDKFQLLTQVWPKLPRSVVQVVGPRLRRHLPFA